MKDDQVTKIITVVMFFCGLAVVFIIGIGKFPIELSSQFQRKISSQSAPSLAHSSAMSAHDAHGLKKEVEKVAEKVAEKPSASEKPQVARAVKTEEIDEDDSMPESTSAQPSQGVKISTEEDRAYQKSLKAGVCQAFELRGESATRIQVSPSEWKAVIDIFHQSKDLLVSWLSSHSAGRPAEAVKKLEASVRGLRIVQPIHAAVEEPDLAWRGIGVRVQDERGRPMILVGGGFLKLMKLDRKRASFEMTRLVAQSFSPCALVTLGLQQFWSPLLTCLGEPHENVCSPDHAKEGTWAVSTSLAAFLSPPGCRVPAFHEESKNSCLKKYLGSATAEEAKTTVQKRKLEQ